MTFAIRSLNALATVATVAAAAGAAFAPVAGGRIETRVWVRGAGYVGTDKFEGAEERALGLLRLREEEERVEEVLQALAARA